jgi:tetrahydromethanopterin S-methyltransferase subunit H
VDRQLGEYSTAVVPSIFQMGDRVFESAKRKEGFNRKRAEELLRMTEKLSDKESITPLPT